MALVVEADITLDLPFGTVEYSRLDRIIHDALAAHGIPVLDVEIGNLRPAQPTIDPTGVVGDPNSPFAPVSTGPLGPARFGRIQ